ncbi:hypothetical protein ANO11243_093360 [Dothideomycetidae sp. 11243]|nr:hypothetical protein ANO11243_093360 [fungal sp. No.11243]
MLSGIKGCLFKCTWLPSVLLCLFFAVTSIGQGDGSVKGYSHVHVLLLQIYVDALELLLPPPKRVVATSLALSLLRRVVLEALEELELKVSQNTKKVNADRRR